MTLRFTSIPRLILISPFLLWAGAGGRPTLAQEEGGFLNLEDEPIENLDELIQQDEEELEELKKHPQCIPKDHEYNKGHCDLATKVTRESLHRLQALRARKIKEQTPPEPPACDESGVAGGLKAEAEFCGRCRHLCGRDHSGKWRLQSRIDAKHRENRKAAEENRKAATKSEGPRSPVTLRDCRTVCRSFTEKTKPTRAACERSCERRNQALRDGADTPDPHRRLR